MSINLELKAKITSRSRIFRALKRMGEPSEILVQRDTYFRVKSGRLKLREFGEGKAELIYYKRNEKKGRRWSEYSILCISDSKITKELLKNALGIDVVVRKKRHVYYYKGGARIHFDKVTSLGTFIEFEVQRRRNKEKAIVLYNELMEIFGIDDKNVIRCSYSDLIRQRSRLRKTD